MTEEAWAKGMAELSILPAKETGAASAALRGRIYREELRYLRDDQWAFAVREAIRKERWFPTVACLLDYATDFEPTTKLLGPGRSPDQKEMDREEVRRGLEMIRAHCPWLSSDPVRDIPGDIPEGSEGPVGR